MRNLMWALMVVAACEGHNDSSTEAKTVTKAPEARVIHVPHEQGGSVVTSAQFFGELHQNDKAGFRVEQNGNTLTIRTSRTTCDKAGDEIHLEYDEGRHSERRDGSVHRRREHRVGDGSLALAESNM